MRIDTEQRNVTAAGVGQAIRARVAATAKVFNFFSTQTYSDIPRALVREWTANALDSHLQAGVTDPVHIYLPDDFDPYFRVKDTGLGMSHDFVVGPFMEYSNGSTKDGTNEVIGGFGIGSKVGLAVSDQFIIRSVHNGEVGHYSVFKDEEDIPAVLPLGREPTSEANGVEFSVPIEPEKFADIKAAAIEHLRYFENVVLHGAELVPQDYVQRGGTWGVRPRDGENVPQVIMGGVAYPIDKWKLDHKLRYDPRLNPLLDMPLDLYLPIGSCSIPISREALLYDAKTEQAIKDALTIIIDEIVADIPTMFDHLPGKWDASKALWEYLGGDTTSPRSRLVLGASRYKGEALETTLRTKDSGYEKAWVIDARNKNPGRGRNRGYTQCPHPRWDNVLHGVRPAELVLIIDDLPPTSKSATIKRIRTYVDEELELAQRVLVVRPYDFEKPEEALEALGNPSDYVLTSSMPAPERVKAPKGMKVARPKVRMFQITDRLKDGDRSAHPSRYGSPVKEIAYTDQPDTGILVVMDSFELPYDFHQRRKFFEDDELFLVNKSDAAKLKSFVDFNEEYERRRDAELLKYPTASQSVAILKSELGGLISFMLRNPELFTDVPKSKPLFKLKQLIDKYVVNLPAILQRLVVPEMPPELDPKKLMAAVDAKHPHFNTLRNALTSYHVAPGTPLANLYKAVI